MNTLRIGLVSISDRASSGVYQDKGIPALEEWLTSALTTPFELETRLIPDEQAIIEQTLCELVDEMSCHLVLIPACHVLCRLSAGLLSILTMSSAPSVIR